MAPNTTAASALADVEGRPLAATLAARPRGLLALATSGAWTSVAVLRVGSTGLETNSVAEPGGAGQSTRLLAMIEELLGADGLASIDAIAFDAGPGAFTGLRIGCSVAQGIGLARGLPLIPVGSLEAAAWRSARSMGVREAVVLVANDARMGELYAAVCAVRAPDSPQSGPFVETLAAPRIVHPSSPPPELALERIGVAHPSWAGAACLYGGDAWRRLELGEGWRALADCGAGSAGGSADNADPLDALPGDAQAVAELGWRLLQAGRAVDAAQAVPRYVRDKVALDVDEQRRLREGKPA